MQRIRLLSLLALSGFVLGFGSSVHAGSDDDCAPPSGMMHMGMPGPGMHMQRMHDELGLTDEQKSKLEAWHKEHDEQGGNREAMRKMHKEMQELMNADTVDEAAIRAKVHELTDAHADMAIQHAYFMQYFRSILTPEQLEKFKAMQAEHHDEFMETGFFHRRAH